MKDRIFKLDIGTPLVNYFQYTALTCHLDLDPGHYRGHLFFMNTSCFVLFFNLYGLYFARSHPGDLPILLPVFLKSAIVTESMMKSIFSDLLQDVQTRVIEAKIGL